MRDRISISRGSLIKRKYIKYFIALVVVIALGVVVKNAMASLNTSTEQTKDKITVKPAIANKDLQREFAIRLTDETGEEIEGVKMRIENVELRDEIIVQSQKASSVAGRSFLVVNMKLVNGLTQAVEINTKDYLRLGINDTEWLAPDIHNDPVLIQAISTKPTRVAFPVSSDLRHFTLQVGEIAGEKERVDIDFTQ